MHISEFMATDARSIAKAAKQKKINAIVYKELGKIYCCRLISYSSIVRHNVEPLNKK